MRNNDDGKNGQAGTGTLIVFIAMILVAAVTVAVLIQTSNVLPDKHCRLNIQSIDGIQVNKSINLLEVQLMLSRPSMFVDLNQIKVTVINGTTKNNMVYSRDKSNNDSYFTVKVLQDTDGSLSRSNPVINKDDIVIVHILGLSLPTETSISIVLTPILGQATAVSFKTPDSYGSRKILSLYP